MCFGEQESGKKEQSSTASAPAWLTNAAQGNLSFINNLQNKGFQAYGGPRVADFSGLQNKGFDMAGSLTGENPFSGEQQNLINNYATAGPSSVTADPIYGGMSPYMSQYVESALNPTMHALDIQFGNENRANDAAATMAGAYGDTGWANLVGNTRFNQDMLRAGTTAQAYDRAFNTAIGASAQDVANRMTAGTTNAQLREAALGRGLQGSQALTGLDTYNTNKQLQIMQALLGTGGLQQQQQQQQLNVPYSDYLMAQQYPFMTSQAFNSALGAATPGAGMTKTGTETSYKPDNSGWAMAGSVLGAVI